LVGAWRLGAGEVVVVAAASMLPCYSTTGGACSVVGQLRRMHRLRVFLLRRFADFFPLYHFTFLLGTSLLLPQHFILFETVIWCSKEKDYFGKENSNYLAS
jgi:hypothetical protein